SVRDGSFGEFDDYLCWTSISVSDTSFEIYKACKAQSGGDPEHPASLDQFAPADVRRAIAEIGAIHHENRHIQDVFGPPAGLSVVFGFWDCVLRFLRVCRAMKREGKSWRMPLPVRQGADESALLAVRGFLTSRRLYDEPLPPS